MIHNNSAFTLIELLVVMAIGVFIISLATPAGIRLYDSFSEKIDTLYLNNFSARASWESFVRQEQCSIQEEKSENSLLYKLVCGKEIIMAKELKKSSKSPSNKGNNLPSVQYFSAKGVALSTDRHSGSPKSNDKSFSQ